MHKTISEIENKHVNIEKTPDRCYLKRCQLRSLRESWLRQIHAHSLFAQWQKSTTIIKIMRFRVSVRMHMCQISFFNHSFHFSHSLCQSFCIGFCEFCFWCFNWFFSVFVGFVVKTRHNHSINFATLAFANLAWNNSSAS